MCVRGNNRHISKPYTAFSGGLGDLVLGRPSAKRLEDVTFHAE